MKTSLGTALVLGTVLLGVTSSTARAEEVCWVTVPFPFVVNGHEMPSGRYDVRTIDADPAIVTIDGMGHTRGHAMVSTIGEYGRGQANGKPALTFVRDGNQYRLSRVWENGDFAREVISR
jgi:hypothetical protein